MTGRLERAKREITRILQPHENKLVQMWQIHQYFLKNLPSIIIRQSFYQNASLCSGSFKSKFGGDVSRSRIDSVQENPPLILQKEAQGTKQKQMGKAICISLIGI